MIYKMAVDYNFWPITIDFSVVSSGNEVSKSVVSC